uniref:Predicted ATP-binding protein involved in virulence n=1 Tax=Candidatus Kentrum sp. TUN TaxID=2126343 RepID=A0A450ZQE1_9GAMM|nr:MAG: Predicted ATP-binding protein involved in virulence [Candidatus Kentron sp. TUN]VFK51532.1 MAG: Predicted ATP-binding protein involved in virulence [Candidatus Kentron sp. TUN]VFK55990.1 MAG: Predicted ATP-binding protein involved in virulence [Candidatus Kentron sp. TUN]
MLKKIQIKGLFDKFDYEIELKEGGLTILTGPNGYGKTTILKTINAVATGNLAFFFKLPFAEITLVPDGAETICLRKKNETIEIELRDKILTSLNKKDINKEIRRLLRSPRYAQLDENILVDRRTETIYKTEDLIAQLYEENPENKDESYPRRIPEFIDVYLIQEQRLIRKLALNRRRMPSYHFDEDMQGDFSNTIEEYAKELSGNIKDIFADASKIGQKLDSSFPNRLFDETGSISKEEFNKRYDLIRKKQNSLSTYGLSTIKEEEHTSFKEENATALLVYLNDMEKKLAAFDEILQRLEVFSSILNKRQFVSKQIEISPDFGFRFITEDGKELSLTDLSSGEQQEVVLLYELLFKVTPNTLVLIDEPEISLHVAWQKEFLDDLLKIVELQKITVLVATHSPQIIKGRWDLAVDLWDLATGSEGNPE